MRVPRLDYIIVIPVMAALLTLVGILAVPGGAASAQQATPQGLLKIYLAGPLGFSEVGREFEDHVLVPKLIDLGYQVIDPFKLMDKSRIDVILKLPTLDEQRDAWRALDPEIAMANQMAIDGCDAVLAVLDGPDVDSGTASEIGYAFARGKPILGYRGDFRLSADNLGSTINLQVEHFISASGGEIVTDISKLPDALSRLSKVAAPGAQPLPVAPPNRRGASPSPQHTAEIIDLVNFFQRVFTVILALALGEAFKQFVADRAKHRDDPVMQWDRTPALLAFLLMILPFYQGMSRYFFVTYEDPAQPLPNPYAAYLMIDGIAFMGESAMFFIMSRALAAEKWRTFYWTVIVLLVIDLVWGFTAMMHGSPVQRFLVLDLIFGPILLGILWKVKSENFCLGAALGLSVLLIRTLADYYFNWPLYFPQA